MDMTRFVFDTNTMIQRVRVGDIQVRVSYAMSFHKTGHEIVATRYNSVN